MRSLGIDIGGTRTKAALVDDDGRIHAAREMDTCHDLPELTSAVRTLVDELADDASPVGLASPGLAARDNRSIAWMKGRMAIVAGLVWEDVLARPVAVLNDGHAAAVGEAWLGAAQSARNALLLTLGTGVGGGVILNGELFQGASGRAGHFGHLTVDVNGRPDLVGTPGSLEDRIGNHSLAERTNDAFADTRELIDATRRGDCTATAAWLESVRALAAAIASLLNAFDPEVIVLGGGIADCGAALLEPLGEMLDRWEWRPFARRVPILPATLGSQAGCIGAARFARRQFPTQDRS